MKSKHVFWPVLLFLAIGFNFVYGQIPTASSQIPKPSTDTEERATINFQFYESSSTCNWGENYRGWNELKCDPIEGVKVELFDKSQTLLISGFSGKNGEVSFRSDELPELFNAYFRKDGYYIDKESHKIVNQSGVTRFFTTTLIRYTNGFGKAEITLYDTKTNQLLELKKGQLKGKGIAYVYLYDQNANFVGQRDLIGEEKPVAIYDQLPVGTYKYYASASGYDDSPITILEITKDSTLESKAFLKPYETNRFIRFLKKLFGRFR